LRDETSTMIMEVKRAGGTATGKEFIEKVGRMGMAEKNWKGPRELQERVTCKPKEWGCREKRKKRPNKQKKKQQAAACWKA